jgi:hypothetical protein
VCLRAASLLRIAIPRNKVGEGRSQGVDEAAPALELAQVVRLEIDDLALDPLAVRIDHQAHQQGDVVFLRQALMISTHRQASFCGTGFSRHSSELHSDPYARARV